MNVIGIFFLQQGLHTCVYATMLAAPSNESDTQSFNDIPTSVSDLVNKECKLFPLESSTFENLQGSHVLYHHKHI